jgi:hypothetical protein
VAHATISENGLGKGLGTRPARDKLRMVIEKRHYRKEDRNGPPFVRESTSMPLI